MKPTGYRILHIHPTRQCNLQCLHCYSTSGPEAQETIEFTILSKAINDAKNLGYNILSFSGGEPLMYPDLLPLLQQAKKSNFQTLIVSNGILLNQSRLASLVGAVDLLAISLDGKPESHNRMRGSQQAFAAMQSNLKNIRASQIPFGFLFVLTQENFQELDWVMEFALKQGAKLLQVHPLSLAGRAEETLQGSAPQEDLMGYAYAKVGQLRKAFGDRIHIQLDLIHQETLRVHRDQFIMTEDTVEERCFAELVSPLVIEADGTVVPLQHGFSRQYILGNLKNSSLPELASNWREKSWSAFQKVCENAYAETSAIEQWPIKNWYEAIARQSRVSN